MLTEFSSAPLPLEQVPDEGADDVVSPRHLTFFTAELHAHRACRHYRRSGHLTPERAEQLEQALHEAQKNPEGSPRQRAAEERLLELLLPFIVAAADRTWKEFRRTYLSRADLIQEGRLRAQKLWKGFTPGLAGPGRTLYPAYVLQAVRQHLSTVLAEAGPVHTTQWARKAGSRARKYAEREGVELDTALTAVGASPATALALSLGAQRVGLRVAAAVVADESHVRRDELGAQARAVAALQHLPRRQREAVAGAIGLSRKDGRQVPDRQLAQRLKCSVDELRAAREAGLAALREALEEGS